MFSKNMLVAVSFLTLASGSVGAAEALKQRVLPSAYFLMWSANGERCLVKRGIDRYEVTDAQGQEIWGRTMVAYNVYISPDGNHVAYVLAGQGLFVTNLKTNQERRLVNLTGTQNRVTHLAWSPTSQTLAYWMFSGDDFTETPGQLAFIQTNK